MADLLACVDTVSFHVSAQRGLHYISTSFSCIYSYTTANKNAFCGTGYLSHSQRNKIQLLILISTFWSSSACYSVSACQIWLKSQQSWNSRNVIGCRLVLCIIVQKFIAIALTIAEIGLSSWICKNSNFQPSIGCGLRSDAMHHRAKFHRNIFNSCEDIAILNISKWRQQGQTNEHQLANVFNRQY